MAVPSAKDGASSCINRGNECEYASTGSLVWPIRNSHSPRSAPDTSLVAQSAESSNGSLDMFGQLTGTGAGSSTMPDLNLQDLELMMNWCNSGLEVLQSKHDYKHVWQVIIPRQALRHPFLMHGILALSALHLARKKETSGVPDDDQGRSYMEIALGHQSRALALFRPLLGNINAENCNAMFLLSTLMTAFAFGFPQTPDPTDAMRPLNDLHLVLHLARGMQRVLNTAMEWIKHGELAVLMELDAYTPHLPSSAKDALRQLYKFNEDHKLRDPSHESEVYIAAISQTQYMLENIYAGVDRPNPAVMWAIKVPASFLELIAEYRPMALVVLAYYCVVLHHLDNHLSDTIFAAKSQQKLTDQDHDLPGMIDVKGTEADKRSHRLTPPSLKISPPTIATMASKPTILYVGRPIRYATSQWEKFEQNFNIIPYTSQSKSEFISALSPGGAYSSINGILRPSISEPELDIPLLDKEIVSHIPSTCRIISSVNHGYDGMDTEELEKRGIWYCNGAGAANDSTADIALFLIIAAFRYTTFTENKLREMRGAKYFRVEGEVVPYSNTARNRILGVVGMGKIGVEISLRARALGMKIHYYSRTRRGQDLEDGVLGGAVYHDSLKSMLAVADCVVLACPHTAETHHLLNRETFGMMKKGVRIVNIGRGKCVDEDALADAIEDGTVAGAGLDVYHDEPVVNPRLLDNMRITLLPHMGGACVDTHENFERIAIDNIEAYFLGNGKPITPVNNVTA
ncbi:hypothetical protein FQN53_000217 [Emmonsiellopsis sp. PD_33]|nr:hypothetical protein FQN53_000217 [Emmonsiellopsis sp. PD_33]